MARCKRLIRTESFSRYRPNLGRNSANLAHSGANAGNLGPNAVQIALKQTHVDRIRPEYGQIPPGLGHFTAIETHVDRIMENIDLHPQDSMIGPGFQILNDTRKIWSQGGNT